MNEKKKCPNCGLLIDEDLEKCPYCGYNIKENENNVTKDIKDEPIVKVEEPKTKARWLVFAERRDVSIAKEIPLFLFMVLGLTLISLVFQIVTLWINPYFLESAAGSAMTNFSIYFVAFGTCLFIINKDVTKIFYKFKERRTWIYGIAYGFFLIIASALYNMLSNLIFGNVGSNNNENSIDAIVASFPVLSLIVFSCIGPICEEFGYRLGLFSFLRRYNRILAYIVSAIIFGFIHFDFSSFNDSAQLSVELINIPSYVISGLILCYVYDKEGLETSILAHITNNLVAILMTIISTFVQ